MVFFHQITLKLGNFIFHALFSGVEGFSLTRSRKKLKNQGSIVKPCDSLIIAHNFLDESEAKP